MISIVFKKIWLLSLIVLLFGCADTLNKFSRSKSQKSNMQSRSIDSFVFYGEEITPTKEEELLAEHVVYFSYDTAEIQERFKLVLLAHAKKMLEQPDLILRIDGHTDERGSAEYNIGLGERRAKAVARFLEFKGINNDRLISVSYGKEKPAVMGHSEQVWRLNRRAELTYE